MKFYDNQNQLKLLNCCNGVKKGIKLSYFFMVKADLARMFCIKNLESRHCDISHFLRGSPQSKTAIEISDSIVK